ncbi:hypothetical protein NUACC26_016890 [Scytonema sp. NUACC26]
MQEKNVFPSQDGSYTILDFGLIKLCLDFILINHLPHSFFKVVLLNQIRIIAIDREDLVKIKQCLLLLSIDNIFKILTANNVISATLELRKK